VFKELPHNARGSLAGEFQLLLPAKISITRQVTFVFFTVRKRLKFPPLLNHSIMRHFLKKMPHNMGGSLAGEFQPSATCKFLDLPPGLASPFLLKTVH